MPLSSTVVSSDCDVHIVTAAGVSFASAMKGCLSQDLQEKISSGAVDLERWLCVEACVDTCCSVALWAEIRRCQLLSAKKQARTQKIFIVVVLAIATIFDLATPPGVNV